jgi:hypothetical protein
MFRPFASLSTAILVVTALPAHASEPLPPREPAGGEQFELDGNPLQDSTLLGDWSALTGGNGNFLAFTGVIADPGQDTIFAGGPKDIQDMNKWTWKNNGGFPDKNDITNAFAAAYDSGGDLIVYFGADRFANSGDAYLGFWFFKDRVTLNPNGTFAGQHQVGDLLVLVNYPQGTTSQPEVLVLEWNPALQDVATNLHKLYGGTGSRCGAGVPSTACAITNAKSEPAPWSYQSKSGPSGVFPPESFFEGGVNLSAVLGGTTCFSSFLAETRSSTSVTAALKDFVLGEFPVCDISVTKTCNVVEFTPDFRSFVVDFTATVTNTGAGPFPVGSLLRVVDDAGTPGQIADDVVVNRVLQSPILPGGQLSVEGTFNSAQNPPYNTVTAAITTQDATIQAEAFGVECEPLQLSPRLALSKMCSVVLESNAGLLVVRVDFTGSVQNNGNLPLYVTVNDDKAGLVMAERLLQPGQTVPLSGSYYPTAANGALTDPRTAMFSDTFTATGRNPLLTSSVTAVASANCSLCP